MKLKHQGTRRTKLTSNHSDRSQLHSHEEIPREFLEEPTSTIRTGVNEGAIDKSLAVSQPVDESAVDDSNKVTIKHLDSFDAKRLRIPKRPQMGINNDMFKRLRLETDDDEVSKLSTEKQKTRAKGMSFKDKWRKTKSQGIGSRI